MTNRRTKAHIQIQLYSRRTKQGLWLVITLLEKTIIGFLLLLSYVVISSFMFSSISYLFTFSISNVCTQLFVYVFRLFILFSVFSFLLSYLLLFLVPILLVCDVKVHTLYVLFAAIVIRIDFSSFFGLYLFCLKK